MDIEQAIKILKCHQTTDTPSEISRKYSCEAIDIAIQALQEKQEKENPKPLTLEQLREREGKPVYCIYPGCNYGGEWFIVRNAAFAVRNEDSALLYRYKSEWQAYDHEPKEATND